MGIAEKLELLVTLDPSQGVAGLERLSGAAEEHTKKTETSLARIGAAGMKLGVAGLAAGAFLTQLGDKEKQAGAQLEASITAAGQSVTDYKDRIEEAVKSGEHFGNTAVDTKSALNILVGSYHDTGKALDEMQLVENLAANRHIDLASAADMVARAHGGSAKLFKLFGIQVEQNIDGTKNYDGALAQLSQRLQGQAAGSVEGFTGFLKGLRAEVEDNVAAFGAKYGPAIMATSAAMTAFGGVSSGVAAIMSKVAAAHAATAATATAQAAAEAEVAAAEVLVTTNSAAAVSSLYAMDAATVASGAAFGPWGAAVAAGIVVASTALDLWGAKADHTFSDVQKYAGESGAELVQTFDYIKNEGNSGDLAKIFDLLIKGGDTGVGVLKRYRDELAATGQDTSVVDAALRSAAEAQSNVNDATAEGTKVTGSYKAQLKELHDQLHANADPLFAMIKALADNKKAQEDATAAQKDGKKSAEEKSAADLHAVETALSVHDASLTLAAGVQAGTVSVSAAQVQLAGWVQQGLITQGQANEVAYSFGVVAGKADALDGRNINMTVTTTFHSIGDLGVAGAKDFHGVASGFSGTVSKPTFFLVGEGGEPEDMLVVPHSKGGIARGAGAGGGGSPNSAMGGNSQMTFYIDARGAQQGAGRGIVDALVAHSRSNNAPVALKEWIAN